MSIYDAYPLFFWILLIIALMCGISILVYQSITKKRHNWWLVGILIIFLSTSILILIHTFRGYPLSDPIDLNEHYSWILEILKRGNISITNIYPMVHLLSFNLIAISGLSVKSSSDYLTIIFTMIYILGIYLLVKYSTNSHRQGLLATSFGAVPLFVFSFVYLHPSGDSILLLPLVLYLYHRIEKDKSKKIEGYICLIILGLFISFCHPITTLLLIIILLTFGLASMLYNRIPFFYKDGLNVNIIQWSEYKGISLIIFIIFFTWYLSFTFIQRGIEITYESLVQKTGDSFYLNYIEQVNDAQLSLNQSLELFLNQYGSISIYFLISLLFIIFFINQCIYEKNKRPNFILFTYGIQFLIVIIISIVMFTGQSLIKSLLRILSLPIIMSVVFNGLAIGSLINFREKNGKNIAILIIFILVIMIICTSFSILNFYNSPRVGFENYQVTNMELNGVYWLINYQQNDMVSLRTHTSIQYIQRRFIESSSWSEKGLKIASDLVPTHFGYDQYSSISEALALKYNNYYQFLIFVDENKELLYPLSLYENVRIKLKQHYDQNDFVMLNNDLKVNKLYSNGEVKIFWVIL